MDIDKLIEELEEKRLFAERRVNTTDDHTTEVYYLGEATAYTDAIAALKARKEKE